jgi:hypothetical protein
MIEQLRLSVTKTKYRLRHGVKAIKMCTERTQHGKQRARENTLFIVNFSLYHILR